MFIALVGTPSSGKHAVLDYLVQRHDFTRLDLGISATDEPEQGVSLGVDEWRTFPTSEAMLDAATRAWRSRHVTTALRTWEDIEPWLKRPWFLLVGVDGPLRARYERERRRRPALTLDAFVDEHDASLHGSAGDATSTGNGHQSDLARVLTTAAVRITNGFPDIDGLYRHLDAVNLLDEQRLRPGWDLYFMTLASLAAHRSNCMKRRVGAILVRGKRIISTGYNGTPRGTTNCNEGGCPRCNGPAKGGQDLSACFCLHAEENALLEAGRERIGPDAIIYSNTCPCLLCSVKIVQCGVREVVYNKGYSMDTASATLLAEGGVVLRQMDMPGDH
ncbi:hypothetical protein CcaverHIS002_0507460 [Cutaneotrichosporon cavernicola]|uniref:Deoxycytidylate deaminase n=1 Tax=Cutaneotrichosporon cavernicola TaxID=279322 RepID=A0AA48L762_9TREE|nr:uncharacterized protein CcaverHIS019_0508000 [Cutaneotrichosporon cavernicola]BEI85345.1 hypothetical protein CcaverHIS002_0507460 [Cutaneotrichosporon cavernicola]BEI93172.1 hypothetical protein CcaverHIS019_0508000 [Cutaneotrichosporon cavernicola]BEJ00950.1 hypothetical protein CcaverHIS631_0508070 [Cutaneotrichosporon cavernicola]BEJ08715.1 hypothetical protein CcaverHIS641_0508090 [Cutaneotrichosporon cavernicola]